MKRGLLNGILSTGIIGAIALFAPMPALAAVPVFNGCSASQEADVRAALEKARTAAADSAGYLSGLKASERSYNAPYATWFGGYDSWRYQKVLANYRAIAAALDLEPLNFRCACDGADPGETYLIDPKAPYGITLCDGFWAAPLSGGKSRAGALVEAVSRFKAVADTDAGAPTRTESMALAAGKPMKAIQSASNYRYFAEEEDKAGGEHVALALALILLLLLASHFWRQRRNRI